MCTFRELKDRINKLAVYQYMNDDAENAYIYNTILKDMNSSLKSRNITKDQLQILKDDLKAI